MLMVHQHNLLFQGEVPEVQEEHLLYILGRVITHSTQSF